MLPIGIMHVVNTETLGEIVVKTRKQLKVTQKDLALTAGTGLRFIGDLEKGKPTCHVGKVLKVLRALGIRVELEVP
jgi:y4mF family transcriptional regulator